MTRMCRRRYRRRRRVLRIVIGTVLIAAVALGVMALSQNDGFTAQRIHDAQPESATPAYDREVVNREVQLPAVSWYTIQTGVFSQEASAMDKADDYAERGAPGTVIRTDDGKWRVFIASYGREEDATEVRRRLGEHQRVETYLYTWQCPELRLRLTGMAGQLDMAEAGLTLWSGAGEILRETAVLLDAGQLTVEEALAEVQELDGQINLWMEMAGQRFGSQPPGMVQQMLTRAQAWQARYAAIRDAATSLTALSAALKGQGMEMFDEEIGFRRMMSGE